MVEAAYAGCRLLPAGKLFVYRFGRCHGSAGRRHRLNHLTVHAIGGTDPNRRHWVEDVQPGECGRRKSVDAGAVACRDTVEPPAAPRAPGRRAVFGSWSAL